ncbi:MAG: PIN domain-containing protein [Cyanobacteria bacterium]|jgi:predicted nucleic acid-binding protein|nr:PIN domain-containing protein [Cyanobacteria bacterium GSL.Bin1]
MPSPNYKIYLDACCFNRPFDDLRQTRIYLEAEAVMIILQECELGQWQLINSTALKAELNQIRDLEKLQALQKILEIATIQVTHNNQLYQRAFQFQEMGFRAYDAFHLASAESSKADVFLSTDDRLIKKARRYTQKIQVAVDNPAQWLSQVIQREQNNDQN